MILLRCLTYGVLLLGCSLLMAQDESIEYTLEDSVVVTSERVTDLPYYNTIATRLPVSLLETPVSVAVVKNSLFYEQNSLVLGEAVVNVSGVNPQTQNGVADYFTIRGFSSLENGLILADGTPEPEVSFYNLYNVDRLEVLKGPSTFLYGGNPLSGAINLVHKKPVFDKFARLNASFGQFKSGRAALDAGWVNKGGNFSGRLNGLFQKSDGYRNDKGNQVIGVNPVFTWQIDNRAFLNVSFEYLTSEYTPDSGLPLVFNFDQTGNLAGIALPEIDEQTNFEPLSDKSDQTILRGKVDYNHKLGRSLVLRNKFYYSSLDWQSAGTLLNGVFFDPTVGATFVPRTFSTLDDKQVWLGNQLELLYTVETGKLKHKILAGVEVAQLSDKFTLEFRNGSAVLFADPEVELAPASGVRQFYQQVDGSNVTLAPYVLDRILLTPQVQLLLGGRLDRLSYSDDRTEFDPQTQQEFPLPTDRDYTKFNPLGGLVVKPFEHTALYANYSQAFAPPSTQAGGTPEPEESRQFEAGLKHQMINGRLNASVAYYDLEKKNLALATSAAGLAELGTQRSTGVEVELSVQPVSQINLFASYAYTDAELVEFSEFDPVFQSFADRSGNRPVLAPEHMLSFWLSANLASGIGAGIGGRYAGEQFIAPDNRFSMQSFTLLNAAVYYGQKNWRVAVNLKNLTDQVYYTQGFGTFSLLPGRPFEAVASLEIGI